MVNVAINGFGRIGRLVLKAALENKNLDFVAINDLTDAKTLAHLFKYDSVHGKIEGDIYAKDNMLVIETPNIKREIRICSERDPEKLPWGELNVDFVVESTGIFRDRAGASKHLKAGAKKVVISAPAKDEDITIVMGVNEDKYDDANHNIISNASCTTNCLAPVAKALNDALGMESGLMTTIHAYTNDQRILDLPHSDLRRARAAAMSMIPTTTGAAAAVSLVLPELKGKLDGFAMRVPTPNVSVVDLTFKANKDTTVEEVNEIVKKAAESDKMKNYLSYNVEPLVSIDYNNSAYSSNFDAGFTKVIDGNLVKILSWYDNECGYATRVVDLIEYIVKSR